MNETTNGSGALLRLEAINTYYGQMHILQNANLRVDAGEREADNRRYDIDFEDATFIVASTCPTWAMTMQTSSPPADGGSDCDSSYPGVCIPAYPPDLDCGEIAERDFAVVGSDPHGFDREGDGIGCES